MTSPGRIQNHDPRNREFAYKATRLPSRNVLHRFSAKNLDQFYLSACVGFAGANILNCAAAYRSRKRYNEVYVNPPVRKTNYLTNEDGIDNYSGATEYDPFDWTYPPTDEGSSAIGLMKYWKKYGVITEYRWAFDFDSFLSALEVQPVLIGTDWYESMNTPSSNGYILNLDGPNLGGHQYIATGIHRSYSLIRCENSWGENWGRQGSFYLPFALARQLLANGGDVCVPRFL